jgi:RNA recognition motif-containing protein
MASRNLQKLFVSNLPFSVGHRELRKYFQEFGRVVSANVVFDRKTGISKGYGFVVFGSKKALESLENKQKHILEHNSIYFQSAD